MRKGTAMREIKFRAWDKKYKTMINDIHIVPEYDWLVLSDNDALAERDNRSWKGKGKQYVLMQFTGLRDKNGREVFEGDILGSEKGRFKLPPVVMEDGVNCGCCDDYRGWSLSVNDAKKYKVIGNIYENPDLLLGS